MKTISPVRGVRCDKVYKQIDNTSIALADFVRLLDEYKIDATLLFPSTQSVGLLDRLPEWERIYADDVAVVHVRRMRPENQGSLK